MKKEMAEAIVEAGTELGFEMSVYENYSGRGMFGAKTTGVVYKNENDLFLAYKEVSIKIENNEGDAESFCEEFVKYRRDNMGRDMIVY